MFIKLYKTFEILKISKGIKIAHILTGAPQGNLGLFNINYLIAILILLIVFNIFLYANKIFPYISKLFLSSVAAVKAIFTKHKVQNITGNYKLDRAIAASGYAYDKKQDVFYSKMDAWQRQMGYCRLYDEAAPTFGMVIDSEPIFFEYDNKKWLIEFWKGQYDLTCGAEIGIYVSNKRDVNVAGIFKGTFYDSVSNSDMLYMEYELKKEGETFLTRKGRHWWLTGFRLGEFARPDELTMDIKITLKNQIMLKAFLKGLINTGYRKEQIIIDNNTISLEFNKPYAKQPFTRTEKTDEIILNNSKLLCATYQEITAPYETLPDKVVAVRDNAPHVYKHIINIGKREQIFWNHDIINKYIGGDIKERTMTNITDAFNAAEKIPFDNSSKFVIMSDAHRGVGNKSDDFIKNEKLYFGALKKYYDDGYTFFELGDGEELWENRSMQRIINTYTDLYLLFKKFHTEGRLYFIYGNHDKVKQSEAFVKNNMYLYYDWRNQKYKQLFKNLKTYEAIILEHNDYKKNVFLLHGHQIDFFNSKLWYIARFLSRYLWKPLELIGIQDPTRTAKVHSRKIAVERKLTEWIIKNKHMVIAGHTHRPVFANAGTPPYFNDGSCVNPSGITAIEIENGSISLVKWSYKINDENKRHLDKDVLEGPVELKEYLEQISKSEKTIA